MNRKNLWFYLLLNVIVGDKNDKCVQVFVWSNENIQSVSSILYFLNIEKK